MSNGLLRRILAVQSFILGFVILIAVLVFGHAGNDGIETLKTVGVVLGLAIYIALSLRVYQLLKSPEAGGRTNVIGMILCLPSIAYLALTIFEHSRA